MFPSRIQRCIDDIPVTNDVCFCNAGGRGKKVSSGGWHHQKRSEMDWTYCVGGCNEQKDKRYECENGIHERRFRQNRLWTRTEMDCLLRKLGVHDTKARENLNVNSFANRPSCQTRSEALEITSRTKCSFVII